MNIQELKFKLVATSGDNLIIYDTNSNSGEAIKVPAPELPPNLTKGQLEVLNKEDRTIVSLAISRDERLIAVATENKQIVVYAADLTLQKNFIVNRTASKIVFTNSGDMLVADRTGDVYLYKLDNEKGAPILLLGHLSMILDMVLSECGKYIITCDRDEKIRVSHFPNTYNIVSYCLGHDEFVTAIKIVQKNLLSGSGDGTIRIWDYISGKQLSIINTNDYVDNATLIEQFSDRMDKEKVDVSALPIVDMQIYNNGNYITIAVCLYSYKAVQIYNVMLDTYRWNHVTTVPAPELPFKIFLSENLCIFDNEKVTTIQVIDNNYVSVKCPQIEDFYEKFKSILKVCDNNFITVLYKRKFDNVQEYLERKKLRLEGSNKMN